MCLFIFNKEYVCQIPNLQLLDIQIRLLYTVYIYSLPLFHLSKDWISKNDQTRVYLFLMRSFYAEFQLPDVSNLWNMGILEKWIYLLSTPLGSVFPKFLSYPMPNHKRNMPSKFHLSRYSGLCWTLITVSVTCALYA